MSRKLTQIEFEEKIHSAFPDIIVKGEYKGSTKKILFGCKNNENHIWEATPNSIYRSHYNGCPFCGRASKRKEEEDFKKELTQISPDIEVLGNYIDDRTPILIKHKGFKDHIWKTDPNHLLRGNSCPYCSGKLPLKGFNTFGDYYPEFVSLFKDKEEPFKYTYGSKRKIKLVCPDCGSEKTIYLSSLSKRGFSCQVCKDSVSIPNKFIRNIILLKQNILNEFEFEYSTKWAKYNGLRFRYDAYFKYNNETYIVEMHGMQHKTKKWCGKPIKIYDDIKRNLAQQNGINYYIEIEADESGLNYLRENFIQTILKDIFILTEDEWKQVGIKMSKSILVEVCKYFNNNPGIKIKQVSKHFHINEGTVRDYLKRGNEIGLCTYIKNMTLGKHIMVLDEKNNRYFIFSSISKCKKCLSFYYKEVFSEYGIMETLHKKRLSYKGFVFKYLNEIDDIYKENRGTKNMKKKIELYQNGKYINTYGSITEASKQTGISKGAFTDWIKGCRKSRQGYTVKVIEQDYL